MAEESLGERNRTNAFVLSARKRTMQKVAKTVGEGMLFAVASFVAVIVLFIFYFVARDAVPFFQIRGFSEFFTSSNWYPASEPAEFGALAIIYGSLMVTLGSALIAVPMGVAAAICLSDILPFSIRQYAKLLQNNGGPMLMWAWWILVSPFMLLAVIVISDLLTTKIKEQRRRQQLQILFLILFGTLSVLLLFKVGTILYGIQILTGTNALNVSIILSFMALPTIVSVSEDALQAVGRELREGSYALGATRAETIIKTVLPAASSGILAAVILGVMRALGETMVVWMASGNSSHIPEPWFNYLEAIRTLTATIAGDMGEADQVTGSARFHVLFAMGLLLLVISFVSNLVSEKIVVRQRKILSGH